MKCSLGTRVFIHTLCFSLALNFSVPALAETVTPTMAQSVVPNDPLSAANCVLDLMKELESARDAKCYATANRLENYMYGTSLTSEARFRKSELQKDLLKRVWIDATAAISKEKRSVIMREDAEKAFQNYFKYQKDDEGFVRLKSPMEGVEDIELEPRDLRHYATIAYAFRAILSLQQDAMLDPDLTLLPLDRGASDLMREYLDVITLAVLNLSNQISIDQNSQEITKDIFESGWNAFFAPKVKVAHPDLDPTRHRADFQKILETLIDGKLAAYSKYNAHEKYDMVQKELDFVEKNWARYPIDGSTAFKKSLIRDHVRNLRAWSLILYKDAEFIAKENKHALIRPEDMEAAVLHLEPHIINDHEDAVFFPKLNDSLKIKIEAYDMDAYRDFGFHWMAYQKMVLPYLKNNKDSLFADPFASEIFVEAIAQYGVLVWRMTGMLATERSVKEKDNEPVVLRRAHLRKAVSAINSLADLNAKATVEEHVETRILSAPNVQAPDAQTLLEVDANSGIDFTYHLAAWRKSWVMDTYGEKIFKAFHGTGIGVADINEDGIEDVLMLSGDGYKLYQGNGNGTFTDITKKSGIELPDTHNNIGEPFQPLLADFDNDGKTDIIITFSYNNHLVFRNKGNGTFENLTQKVNIGSKSDPSVAAVTADFDNDGLLDLYVTNFGDTVGGLKPEHGTGKEDLDDEIEDADPKAKRPSESRKRPATLTLNRNSRNATPNVLYKNMGNFVFKDVTEGSGTDDTGWANGAGHTDFDLDGDQDIIIANDFGRNGLLRNDGNMKFTDVTLKYGLVTELNSMNVGLSDLNKDGFPDIYFSNINAMNKDGKYTFPEKDMPIHFAEKNYTTTRYVRRSVLYMSFVKDGKLSGYQISDKIGREQENSGWAWDADFFDADNDGDDDLYVVNGYSVYKAVLNKDTKEAESGKFTTGKTSKQKSIFFLNHNNQLMPQKDDLRISGVSYSAVYMDYDQDGDLDILMNRLEKPSVMIKNRAEQLNNNWIKVRLIGDSAKQVNRDAIGAKVYFTLPDGERIWREIHGGGGYLSFESKTLHVGTAKNKAVNVEIVWPNGQKQIVENLAANHTHEITQNGAIRQI